MMTFEKDGKTLQVSSNIQAMALKNDGWVMLDASPQNDGGDGKDPPRK